jgi:hypothetical protein
MSGGKVKAAKVKVHQAPEGVAPDGHHHVYVFDVFNRSFLPGKAFDTLERAAQFQRHEQERIYVDQEADPELFDLPFISADVDLIARCDRDSSYKSRLMRDLDGEARARARKR